MYKIILLWRYSSLEITSGILCGFIFMKISFFFPNVLLSIIFCNKFETYLQLNRSSAAQYLTNSIFHGDKTVEFLQDKITETNHGTFCGNSTENSTETKPWNFPWKFHRKFHCHKYYCYLFIIHDIVSNSQIRNTQIG